MGVWGLSLCFIMECTFLWSLQKHNYLWDCSTLSHVAESLYQVQKLFGDNQQTKIKKRTQTEHDCISGVSLGNHDGRSLRKITHIFHSWPRTKACQAVRLQVSVKLPLLHFPNIPGHVSRQRKIPLKYF